MKKTFRSVLTMLLVLALLLGVMAPTVLAAGSGESVENVAPVVPTTDTLDTGWCVITYDTDAASLTLTLYPDVDSVRNLTKAEIKQQVKDIANQLLVDLNVDVFICHK